MAVVEMTCEMDVMNDAFEALRFVHVRLAKCHGDDYRKLDRAIDHLLENPEGAVDVHWLGGGRMIAVPTGPFTDILREARRLGVTA